MFTHDAVQVLPAPFTILVEDVPERGDTVQHIDCIYILRPVSDPTAITAQETEITNLRWVPIRAVGGLPTPPELPALIQAAADHAGSFVR